MNWKVGDKAVILKSVFPDRVGVVVTIMSALRLAVRHKQYGKNVWVHNVNLRPRSIVTSDYASYPPECLGPLYDGNELSTWSECEFKPKELVLVTQT